MKCQTFYNTIGGGYAKIKSKRMQIVGSVRNRRNLKIELYLGTVFIIFTSFETEPEFFKCQLH